MVLQLLENFARIVHFFRGGLNALIEVDITRLTIVRCQKCQRGVSLLFYRSYDEIAVHYCRRCDYTFATDLRGKLLGHIERANLALEKIHA